MLVLYCFCVATEFSVDKDLYKNDQPLLRSLSGRTVLTDHSDECRTYCTSHVATRCLLPNIYFNWLHYRNLSAYSTFVFELR